jgi:hypothetical protein
MKRLIIAVMLVAFTFTLAYAADTVTYENKKGNVTFDHKSHSAKMDCKACHAGEPAKIAVEKNAAHGDTSNGCQNKESGPTKCNDCHKK